MDFKLETPSALGYFSHLVQSDASLPILEAAASLGHDEYPDLDVQQVLNEVDQLISRLKRRLPSDASAMHRLRVLNKLFFDELGFRGNVNHYYDPDNSFIHCVLKTRKGIPISLSVLWLELATSLGLDASGVNFPGHFLLKVMLPYPHAGQVIIDPFTGMSLSKEALLERLNLSQLQDFEFGGRSNSTPSAEEMLKHFLTSATERQILTRMLGNLADIYSNQSDVPRLQQIEQRLAVLNPLPKA
jgi:regulator of sirC expression with transglutaminase-like and TPR domain